MSVFGSTAKARKGGEGAALGILVGAFLAGTLSFFWVLRSGIKRMKKRW